MSLVFRESQADRLLIGTPTIGANILEGTALAWIYVTGTANHFGAIWDHSAGLSGTGWCLYKNGVDGTIFECLLSRATTSQNALSATGQLKLNTWQFVAGTWSFSGTTCNVFWGSLNQPVANVTSTSTNGVGASTDDSGNNFVMGSGGANAMGMHASFAQVYTRVLSVAELQKIQRDLVMLPGCLVSFRLGLLGPTMQIDRTGHGLHATLSASIVRGDPLPIRQLYQPDIFPNRWTGKSFTKTLSGTETSAATVNKGIGRALFATETSAAKVNKGIGRSLSATSTTAATVLKNVGRALSATSNSTASVLKNVGRTISASSTGVAVLAARGITRTLSATSAIAASLGGRSFAKALNATVASAATVNKGIGRSLSATANTLAVLSKNVGRTLSATVSSLASLLSSIMHVPIGTHGPTFKGTGAQFHSSGQTSASVHPGGSGASVRPNTTRAET